MYRNSKGNLTLQKRDRRSENGDNVGEESSGSINDSFAVQANRNAGINANVTASDELPPTSIQVAPFSVLSPCATASLQAFTLEKEPVQVSKYGGLFRGGCRGCILSY